VIKIISHNMCHKILAVLLILILFLYCGCSFVDFSYFSYKDTIMTELVSFEQLPDYNKLTVCQGPAILELESETLFCIVRCYDSDVDRDIDVFEYSLTVRQKDQSGHFFHLLKKYPHVLIIDGDFDGIGDNVYIFRLISGNRDPIYKKIDIGPKKLVMNDFPPAYFKLSDFKGSYLFGN